MPAAEPRTLPPIPVRAAAPIVGTLAAVWVGLQVVAIILGLAVVGRHGTGPAHHLDVPVHDWFVLHRAGLIGISKSFAVIFDAPLLGVIVVVGTVAIVAFAWIRGWFRWSLLVPLVAYVGAEATVFVVRTVIHRPRPASANFPGVDAIRGVHETSWSFPSGHATASMAVLVACAGLIASRSESRRVAVWITIVAVVIALVIAASRLVLGVHWGTDVLVGALLGGVWGATVVWAGRDIDRVATSSTPDAVPQVPVD